MTVKDVMTIESAFCGLETTLDEASRTMAKIQCGFLPVVGEGGNVIGAITDRDICIALGKRKKSASEVLVGDVMLPRDRTFPKLFVCTPDDHIHCVLKTMRQAKVRRLPVVGPDGELKGILSLDDLVLAACENASKEGISCRDVIETYKEICRPQPKMPQTATTRPSPEPIDRRTMPVQF